MAVQWHSNAVGACQGGKSAFPSLAGDSMIMISDANLCTTGGASSYQLAGEAAVPGRTLAAGPAAGAIAIAPWLQGLRRGDREP